jgi:hypothetical protein
MEQNVAIAGAGPHGLLGKRQEPRMHSRVGESPMKPLLWIDNGRRLPINNRRDGFRKAEVQLHSFRNRHGPTV